MKQSNKLFSMLLRGQLRPKRPTGLPAFCKCGTLHREMSGDKCELNMIYFCHISSFYNKRQCRDASPVLHILFHSLSQVLIHCGLYMIYHNSPSLRLIRPIDHIVEHLPYHRGLLHHQLSFNPWHLMKTYLTPLTTDTLRKLRTTNTLVLFDGTVLVLRPQL